MRALVQKVQSLDLEFYMTETALVLLYFRVEFRLQKYNTQKRYAYRACLGIKLLLQAAGKSSISIIDCRTLGPVPVVAFILVSAER